MKKLLLFLLGLGVGLIIIDRGLSTVLDQIYRGCLYGNTGGKINYFLAKEPASDLLIMGSSRSYRQIDPDSFSVNTFNLSHNGMRIPSVSYTHLTLPTTPYV